MSLFKQRFNAAKCKTLLKLTIPRVKLLRNRREIQLKQMRRDIAKLLETGQEATARIRVEHIIREEKMMAAQEIVELFAELISVRLPIIEAQRECPLDLKEAISTICFAAPRCADLPELLQVQILFAGKYGKEFVAAATELMPECGVNRQVVELLSVRAPAADVKMKLLKEIAEEHGLDWDPSASESELSKPHEDLLNGPTQFVSASKLPFPQENLDEKTTTPEHSNHETSDFDEDFDIIDFPEVPKQQPLNSNKGNIMAPEMLPFPASALSSEVDDQEEPNPFGDNKNLSSLEPEPVEREKLFTKEDTSLQASAVPVEEKQFVPFMSPPSQSSASFSVREYDSPLPSTLNTKYDKVDLQDVLAAAQAAADSAERAASAARSAASLAQLRISELVNRSNDDIPSPTVENPFHVSKSQSDLDKQHSFADSDSSSISPSQNNDLPKRDVDSPSQINDGVTQVTSDHQPQRLPSMDEEPYFSYPNLFTHQGSNLNSPSQSFKDSK